MANITIKEVAQRAGVSIATVSRVLNNHAYVTEDIRLRVQEAMDLLGYQPNRSARRLRAQSSDILGLIIPDIQNTVFQSLVRGVEDAAYARQLNVVLCNTDDNLDKQKAYLRVMTAEKAAGLIVVPTHPKDGAELSAVRDAGISIVLLDREVRNFESDIVKVDNVHGAYLAMRHLITLGYKRIGIIAGTQYLSPGRERLQGCKDALDEFDIPAENTVIEMGNFKLESGYELTKKLMQSDNPPDVIFTANNLMTMGAMRALHDLGVSIPEQVALIGFDDMPWAQDLNPPLTAISQPSYELGAQAVQLLLKRIEQPDAAYQRVTLQPRLIVRQSCGAKIRNANFSQ